MLLWDRLPRCCVMNRLWLLTAITMIIRDDYKERARFQLTEKPLKETLERHAKVIIKSGSVTNG